MARALSNPVLLASPEKGIDGRTVLTKARTPLITDGRIGDFWIDTVGQKLYGPKNAAGWPDNGLIKGNKGWAPVFGAVTDGSRRVQRVVDWVGGEGTKPAIGQYVGATGLVDDLASAVDIRGPEGPEMLISGLDDASVTIADGTFLPTAEASSDNEKRTITEIFDIGAVLDRQSVAHAQATTVRKNVKRLRTQFYAPLFAVPSSVAGGASYRRVNSQPSHSLKFRTLDRWTAAGDSDSVNGGWWEIAEDVISIRMFGCANDNSADIGPLFNAALISGRHYVVPAGDYLVATTIGGVSFSNITIEFLDGAAFHHASSLHSKCIQFNTSTGIRITASAKLGRIDVSAAPNSVGSEANDAIYFSGGASNEVDHIHVYAGATYSSGGGDSGVFGNCSDLSVHDCIFEGIADTGIYISGNGGGDTSVGRAKVYNNKFINCLNAGGSKRLYQSTSWRNNNVVGGVTGFYSGEADTDNLPGVRNEYVNNQFDSLTGPAIISRISQYDQIIGNIGVNLRSDFIVLQGSVKPTVAQNRLYIDPSIYVSPSTQAGIRIMARTFNSVTYNSTDGDIRGNLFDGVYTPIIEADVNQDRNAYNDNRAFGNTNQVTLLGPKSYVSTNQTRKLQGITTGYTGAEKVETQQSFQSTTSSTLNAFTLPVAVGKSVRIAVDAIASDAGAHAYTVRLSAGFHRATGGNVTLLGTQEKTGEAHDFSSAPALNLVADTTGQAIRLQAAGLAGITINWVFNITYTILTTNA